MSRFLNFKMTKKFIYATAEGSATAEAAATAEGSATATRWRRAELAVSGHAREGVMHSAERHHLARAAATPAAAAEVIAACWQALNSEEEC